MPGCRLITRLSAVYFIIGGKEVWFRKKMNFKGKIYATPVVKWFRLQAEPFFGRKFAVCYANPQLSFMAKRQKVQKQPNPFSHSVAYLFQINFL